MEQNHGNPLNGLRVIQLFKVPFLIILLTMSEINIPSLADFLLAIIVSPNSLLAKNHGRYEHLLVTRNNSRPSNQWEDERSSSHFRQQRSWWSPLLSQSRKYIEFFQNSFATIRAYRMKSRSHNFSLRALCYLAVQLFYLYFFLRAL